jgi:hypothetical protein
MDVAEWLTAGGTVAVPVLGLVGLYFRPILKKLEELSAETKAQRADIEKLRDNQEGRVAAAKEAALSDAKALKRAMEDHERSDSERFDDLGEKIDAKVGGLRKEIAEGHDRTVQQIKADQAAALEPIRLDIRALSGEVRQRMDSMVSMFAGRLSAVRQQAGEDD